MRGIDSWRNGSDLQLVLVRANYLYAVNGKTGSLYHDFGDHGRVNLQMTGPYTGPFHTSCLATAYGQADRLWIAGVAAETVCRSASVNQLGWQCPESGDHGSGVDRGGLSNPKTRDQRYRLINITWTGSTLNRSLASFILRPGVLELSLRLCWQARIWLPQPASKLATSQVADE